MTEQEKAFWKEIEEHPQEAVHKLVLADWYEDEYPATLDIQRRIAGLRWCAKYGKHPELRNNIETMDWLWTNINKRGLESVTSTWLIPEQMFGRLSEYTWRLNTGLIWPLEFAFERVGAVVLDHPELCVEEKDE